MRAFEHGGRKGARRRPLAPASADCRDKHHGELAAHRAPGQGHAVFEHVKSLRIGHDLCATDALGEFRKPLAVLIESQVGGRDDGWSVHDGTPRNFEPLLWATRSARPERAELHGRTRCLFRGYPFVLGGAEKAEARPPKGRRCRGATLSARRKNEETEDVSRRGARRSGGRDGPTVARPLEWRARQSEGTRSCRARLTVRFHRGEGHAVRDRRRDGQADWQVRG